MTKRNGATCSAPPRLDSRPRPPEIHPAAFADLFDPLALTPREVAHTARRRLVTARQTVGLKCAAAAAALGLPNEAALRRLEEGRDAIPMLVLRTAAVRYGVSLDWLASIVDVPEQDELVQTRSVLVQHVRSELETNMKRVATAALAAERLNAPLALMLESIRGAAARAVQAVDEIRGTTRFDASVRGGARIVAAVDVLRSALEEAQRILDRKAAIAAWLSGCEQVEDVAAMPADAVGSDEGAHLGTPPRGCRLVERIGDLAAAPLEGKVAVAEPPRAHNMPLIPESIEPMDAETPPDPNHHRQPTNPPAKSATDKRARRGVAEQQSEPWVSAKALASRLRMERTAAIRYARRLGYELKKRRTPDSHYQWALVVSNHEAEQIVAARHEDGYC